MTYSKDLSLHVEAIIFASPEGVDFQDLKQIIFDTFQNELSKQELSDLLLGIKTKYEEESSVLQLQLINEHYQFLTKEKYHETIHQLQSHRDKKKLSQSALETLAIVAYRQPITKLEVEQIRGVNCDYSIQRLLEKNLVQIVGKSDALGKPLLYGTSAQFMHYFGINNVADLPQLKDIVTEENSVGEIEE